MAEAAASNASNATNPSPNPTPEYGGYLTVVSDPRAVFANGAAYDLNLFPARPDQRVLIGAAVPGGDATLVVTACNVRVEHGLAVGDAVAVDADAGVLSVGGLALDAAVGLRLTGAGGAAAAPLLSTAGDLRLPAGATLAVGDTTLVDAAGFGLGVGLSNAGCNLFLGAGSNLGVGTPAPAAALHVAGNALVTGPNGMGVTLLNLLLPASRAAPAAASALPATSAAGTGAGSCALGAFGAFRAFRAFAADYHASASPSAAAVPASLMPPHAAVLPAPCCCYDAAAGALIAPADGLYHLAYNARIALGPDAPRLALLRFACSAPDADAALADATYGYDLSALPGRSVSVAFSTVLPLAAGDAAWPALARLGDLSFAAGDPLPPGALRLLASEFSGWRGV